jgi:hypothetical protein
MTDDSLSGPLLPQQQQAAPKARGPKKPRQSVMPAVQKEAGQGGREKTLNIIQDYVMQQTGNPKATAIHVNAIASLIQKKIARPIQFGNTVFLATQKGPGVMDVHLYTEDSPKTLVHRFQQAYQWAKTNGFTTITSTLTDANMAQLVKMAGLPVSLKQTTINDGKQMRPAYQMTIKVQ